MTTVKEKQNIPEGWREQPLGVVCEIINGSTPKRAVSEYWANGDVPWFTVDDIRSNGRIINITNQTITDKALKETSVKLLPEESVLLCCTASLGEVAFAKIPLTTNQQFNGLICKNKEELFPRYLFYSAQNFGENLKRKSGKTTINFLSVGTLSNEKILIPSLKEQQKIAEILEAVDKDIEKTKVTIKAIEKLKRGLMQELFTRGIGHTKFKQTELGEIPEGWEVGGFQNFVDPKDKNAIKPGPFGSALKKEFYVTTGYKIYGQEQVIKNNPYFGNYYINEEKYKSLEGFKIQAKDLLISLVGTIGKTMIVPDDAELGIINPRLLKITLDHSKASVYFVDYLLKGFSVLRQTAGKSHGGTMSILNKGMLMSVKIPVPPKDEQEKIAEILLSLDEKITINKKLLAKQAELKKGLMQDLLSGNKRVTI